MRPKLSIVIPTLNEEHYLPLLLEDLTLQSEIDFEVIVVDAQSKDNTKKAALKYDKKLDLRFVDSPKKQVAFQRNYGAKQAKGNYIFFIDADTRIKNDVIQKIVTLIEKEKKLLYLPIIKPSTPSLFYKFVFASSINFVKLAQLLGRPLSIGPLIVIENKFFHKIGGFDEKIAIAEDHNLIIKAHQNGVKARIIDDISCYFSMRRFENDGPWTIGWQYIRYTGITLAKGGVQKPLAQYEQGGQRYTNTKS